MIELDAEKVEQFTKDDWEYVSDCSSDSDCDLLLHIFSNFIAILLYVIAHGRHREARPRGASDDRDAPLRGLDPDHSARGPLWRLPLAVHCALIHCFSTVRPVSLVLYVCIQSCLSVRVAQHNRYICLFVSSVDSPASRMQAVQFNLVFHMVVSIQLPVPVFF